MRCHGNSQQPTQLMIDCMQDKRCPVPTEPCPDVTMLPTALELFAEATGELGVMDPGFRKSVFHHKKQSRQPGLWSMQLKVIPQQPSASNNPKKVPSAGRPTREPPGGERLVSMVSGQLSTQLTPARLTGTVRLQSIAPFQSLTRWGSRPPKTSKCNGCNKLNPATQYFGV
jgi:hypothetical protein